MRPPWPLAAAERAKAEIATQLALAAMYARQPGFLQLQIVDRQRQALQPSDKIIFTPEGTMPTLVLPGPGIVPTVDTGQIRPRANRSLGFGIGLWTKRHHLD